MSRDLVISQSEKYEGDDWWKWAVWIEGDDVALDEIEYVEWRLHPTFPNPVRTVDDRKSKFKLETAGWGVFVIVARVHTKDGKDVSLIHQLSLHYPDGSQTNA